MESRTNHINFDLDEFKKIEDIIFLDEPILTHLKRKNKNYLLYLVDTVEDLDYYLLLEVQEEEIFKYLTKKVSLRSIISNNEDFIYLIKQDFNGKLVDLKIIQSDSIKEEYLPLEDSYLEYEPADHSYYFDFISSFEKKAYLQSLRDHAFYLKFSPKDSKYLDTIGLNDLSKKLLSNLADSFRNFLKADFIRRFKNDIADEDKLQKIFNQLLPDLDYRTVDFRHGSFEVGLAVDTVMKRNIENKGIMNWAIDVGYKYKNLVLEKNFDNETVDEIIESYSEEDRKKIFKPIFRLTENPKYSFQIKDHYSLPYSPIEVKDKTVIEKIIPNKLPDVEELDLEIFQVTTVRDKNKATKTIRLENTLFNSSGETEILITNKDFEKYQYKLKKEVSIPVKIKAEKSNLFLSAIVDEYPIDVIQHSDNIESGIKLLISKIYEYFLNKEDIDMN